MPYSMRRRILAAAILASAGLYAQNASATLVVGPNTCQPGKPHYATIQAAVTAAPSGGTVLVCPGTYPEQVAITKPLILRGVTDGTSNAAIITVPAGGLVINAYAPTYYGGSVTAQLVVENASGVTVSNLTIDGTGSGCVPGAIREAGIVAYNVGNTVISGVSVRNEVTGCLIGEGIITDTATITIESNQIHDVDRTGISNAGGVVTVELNNVQNANYYGISLYLSNKSVVTSNTIASLNPVFGFNDAAISAQGSSDVIISKNTVVASPSIYNFGIWLYQNSSASTVSGNIVSDIGYGIVLEGSGSNVVQSNRLSELLGDGIYEDTSLGGNNITKNIVNEAGFGIFTDGSAGGDTLVPNSFFNTVTTIDPNPAVIVNPQAP